MDREKLIQYINGENLSEKELVEILDWIEGSEKNQQEYEELKKLWVLSGINEASPVRYRKFFQQQSRTKKFILNEAFMKYAAIFILAFFIGGFSIYLTNQTFQSTVAYNEIQVPGGEKSIITLYDGTKVWLNSGTTLKYPSTFEKSERKVFVNGEAFFDVAKNKNQPFVVNANQIDIKVLGTRFNVYAYQDEPEIQVTLEEGAVHTKAISSKKWTNVKPGEQAIYNNNTKQLHKKTVNTELFSSWKENLLRFEDAPFKDVIKKMEHWYGVRITLDSSIDTEEAYTMTIKTESLREMLNLISKTTQIKYEINENKVLITKP
ncbi:FecR family protein [Sunxiuqinia sp. A32]|uniref:FecR family protein n=1 Tax=Sunxiuqinia sp. A32 TaxID=3461496 RepID=UPI0040467DD1